MKRTMQLQPHEVELLKTLYKQFKVPTDRFPQHPDLLQEFMETWTNLSGRQDRAEEVLHYMFTQRKQGKWVKLGRASATKLSERPAAYAERLTVDDWKVLDAVYAELQVPSDRFALDDELGKKLTAEFAKRTKKIVPQLVLCAAMISRRKGGGLTTLKPKQDAESVDFADIDKVAM